MQSYNQFLQLVERKQEALDLIELIKSMPTDYKMEVASWDNETDLPKREVRTIRLETGTDLIRALSDGTTDTTIGMGLSYEGGGYFSTVFSGANSRATNERQYVLKHSKPGRTGEQDRWQGFAALCQKYHKSNPLFPEVIYYREFEHGEMLAVMEFLEINSDKAYDLGVKKNNFNKIAALVDVLNDNPNNTYAHEQVHGFAKRLGVDLEHLIDFLTKVKSLNANLDIHAQNVGFRGDQMVIFDPVSWNADYGEEGL